MPAKNEKNPKLDQNTKQLEKPVDISQTLKLFVALQYAVLASFVSILFALIHKSFY